MIFTRHSLVRAKGEVLVLLYVSCSFFVNDFSTTRGPIHAKFCMRAYSGSGCVFSPFGVSGPPGGGCGKRGKWNFREKPMSNANGGFVSVLLTHLFFFILLGKYRIYVLWNFCISLSLARHFDELVFRLIRYVQWPAYTPYLKNCIFIYVRNSSNFHEF